MKPMAAATLVTMNWIWPATRSFSAGPSPLYGTRERVDLGGADEVLAGEVHLRADAGVAEGELAGLRLRRRRSAPSRVLYGRVRGHHEHLRPRDDLGDRHEVLLRVVVHAWRRCAGSPSRPSRRERTACSRRAPRGRLGRADAAAGAAAVLDHHGLAPHLRAASGRAGAPRCRSRRPGGNGTMKRTGFCGQDCALRRGGDQQRAARTRRIREASLASSCGISVLGTFYSASAKARPDRQRERRRRRGERSSASRARAGTRARARAGRRPGARRAARRCPTRANLTSGCSVHARKRVERGRALAAPAERPEMRRQEERQRDARDAVHERGPGARCPRRRSRGTPPDTARMPRTASSMRKARSERVAASARASRATPPSTAAQADRRVHRDREHEQRIEGEPAGAAARAGEDLGAVRPPRIA